MRFYTFLLLFIILPFITLESTPLKDSTKVNVITTDSVILKENQKWELSNYPNPFNPSTVITFKLDKEARVTLKVYNILGQLIENLIDQKLPPGVHKTTFNAANVDGILMSGVYFYRIEAWGDDGSNFTAIRKMIYTK